MIQVNLEQLEKLALQLPEQERMQLIERLKQSIHDEQPQVLSTALYGSWKPYFPDDVDVDAILREIRTEWKKKFDD